MEYKFRGKKKPNKPWFYGGFHKHETYTLSPVYAKGEEPPKSECEYLIIESGFSDWNLPKPLQAHTVNPDSSRAICKPKDQELRYTPKGYCQSETNCGIFRMLLMETI